MNERMLYWKNNAYFLTKIEAGILQVFVLIIGCIIAL